MQEVYEFLKKCGTYFIATVDGDQPRVRPFGTINIFEDKLYIQTGKTKPCFQQMLANPKVELCAFNAGTWLRLAGTLVPDERVEPQADMLEHYPELKGRYAPNDGVNVVLYVKDATATFSSFTAPEKVVKF